MAVFADRKDRIVFLRGVFVTYLHYFVHFVSLFVLTPIILRYLGQSGYGLWAILSSIAGYLMLCKFGMNTAVAKYTAELVASGNREGVNGIVSTTFVMFLAIGVIIVLGCLGLTPFIPSLFKMPQEFFRPVQIAFLIVACNTVLMLIGGVFGNVIYGYQRVDICKTCSIAQQIANIFLTILLLYLGLGLVGITLSATLSTFLLIGLYIFFLRKPEYRIHVWLRFVEIRVLREILPYSLRTFVLGLTSQILYFTDNIVIGVFLGAASVTPYFIAYRLCFLATYVPSAISSTLFPKFSELYAIGDNIGLFNLYVRVTKVSVAIMTPIGIFLLFYGQAFIALWVGEGNFAGFHILCVLVLMCFFHAIGTPTGLLLQGIGRNKLFMYSEILNAGLNLALSIILVRNLGLLGVALGTVIAHVCTTFWVVPYKACKLLGMPWPRLVRSGILPPLFLGLPFGLIVLVMGNNLFGTGSFIALGLNAVIIFFLYATLFLCLPFGRSERQLCLRLLRLR